MKKTSFAGMATSLSKELTFKNLLLAKNMEDPNSKLSSCFSFALENLQNEPPCVRSNAHLTISDGPTLMEFTSGKGECGITVFHNQGKVQYDVFVPSWELYVSRLCSSSQPLILGNILSIRSHLHSWGSSRPGFSSLACFDLAAERFSMEPQVIQKDAEMLVECGGKVLKFVSGHGSCKISVFFKQGEAKYEVQVDNWDVVMERFQTGVEPLTLENLWSVKNRLSSPEWLELRCCLDEAMTRFSQEPLCVQNNAKMLIVANNEKIVLISGKGQNVITVIYKFGLIEYKLSERGWWEVAARVLQKKEMLTRTEC
ncbi:uncharacterized protein LOC133380987 [Rhineura floridana]|uniref:uncharacterized protein LOC133380987 n=1 Tax=Rhineura floridana TaxID=261503 RepID=UPI002AC838E0|nr:uncharacterized protein LOC133380987 [Rhineura floridana]